jgi:hypothetical protein
MSAHNITTLPIGHEPYVSRYKALILAIQAKGPRQFRWGSGYVRHHIHPVSLGADGSFCHQDNIAILTNREHYLVHYLLWKAYGGRLTYAFFSMTSVAKSPSKLTARQYERLLLSYREEIKASRKPSVGNPAWVKGRTAWNKGQPMTQTTKDRMRAARLGKASPTKGVTMRESTKLKLSELRSKPVMCIDTGERFPSIKLANEHMFETYGKHTDICSAIKKGQKVGGFRWAYEEER